MTRRKLTARSPFVDLRPAELAAAGPGDESLFLGRLDAEALRSELAEAGILSVLAERGYPEIAIDIERHDGEHRLSIVPRGERVRLVELRLAEEVVVAADALMQRKGVGLLSVLSVRWLALQHPLGRFTPERPRLPGQRYPGLGLSARLHAWALQRAGAWGKDGVLNFPEYFHNAVFYSSLFRFLSPTRQGRFEALRRDLAALPVAAASAALDDGRIVDASGAPFRWEPGEMLAPLTDTVRGYLDSKEYADAVGAARDAARFS
jgi:hypothetical protein